MIKSIFKIKKNDFDIIFNKNFSGSKKNIKNVFFDIKIFKNQKDCINKYSVIISNKNIKKAIDRNKIKRWYFFILFNFIKNKKHNNSLFFIFYPKNNNINIKFSFLEKEVYNELNKIK